MSDVIALIIRNEAEKSTIPISIQDNKIPFWTYLIRKHLCFIIPCQGDYGCTQSLIHWPLTCNLVKPLWKIEGCSVSKLNIHVPSNLGMQITPCPRPIGERHKNVHSSTVYSSKNLERTQMHSNRSKKNDLLH